MSFCIITNNDGALLEILDQYKDYIKVKLIKGSIKDVAFQAREFLMENYSLVADPVAGRMERPTPFLTIILKENTKNESTIGYDVMRVEHFIKVHNMHNEELERLPERYKRDFAEIDKSLTVGCCTQFLMGR